MSIPSMLQKRSLEKASARRAEARALSRGAVSPAQAQANNGAFRPGFAASIPLNMRHGR